MLWFLQEKEIWNHALSAGANNSSFADLSHLFICSIFLLCGGLSGQQFWLTIRFPDGRQLVFQFSLWCNFWQGPELRRVRAVPSCVTTIYGSYKAGHSTFTGREIVETSSSGVKSFCVERQMLIGQSCISSPLSTHSIKVSIDRICENGSCKWLWILRKSVNYSCTSCILEHCQRTASRWA